MRNSCESGKRSIIPLSSHVFVNDRPATIILLVNLTPLSLQVLHPIVNIPAIIKQTTYRPGDIIKLRDVLTARPGRTVYRIDRAINYK